MNSKAKKTKVQPLSKDSVINVLSQDEIKKKVQVIEQKLKSSTWRKLETNGKFEKNDKLLQFTASSGRHSVLERPLSEVNGRLFFS